MEKYYIAYGSNLNLTQMQHRCPGAKVVGIAFINDYRLLFKGSKTGSYLTIEPCAGMKVPVAVWKVNEEHEQSLDHYEGYPAFYYKKEMQIEVIGLKTGRKTNKKVFVYIMHEDRLIGVPSSYYLKGCLEGYKSFGFNQKYLKEALEYSMEVFNEKQRRY